MAQYMGELTQFYLYQNIQLGLSSLTAHVLV